MIEVISRSERRSSIGGEKTMSHFPFRGSPSNNNNNNSSSANNNNNNQVSRFEKFHEIEHACRYSSFALDYMLKAFF